MQSLRTDYSRPNYSVSCVRIYAHKSQETE